jgi:Zn-dependent metalloprotease
MLNQIAFLSFLTVAACTSGKQSKTSSDNGAQSKDEAAGSTSRPIPFNAAQTTQIRLDNFEKIGIADGALKNGLNTFDAKQMSSGLGLDAQSKMRVTRSAPGHMRMVQDYKNVEVFGANITLNENETTQMLSGNIVTGLENAQIDMNPRVSASDALQIAVKHYGLGDSTVTYELQTSNLKILNLDQRALLVHHIVLLTPPQKNAGQKDLAVGRWNYFIDAATGEIAQVFNGMDSLSQASGPGGNAAFAHSWVNELDVEPVSVGSTIYKTETTRQRSYDLAGSTVFTGSTKTGPLTGFGNAAVNDAHGYAEVTLNVLLDWYGYNSINESGFVIPSYVNYSVAYANAHWDGFKMVYGDGGTKFYSLSSGLDVVAHEINHGFTEFHSNLIYSGESGGMNESFSDISGVVTEYFYNPATANFNVGDRVFRAAGQSLRYMCNPPTDGVSIGHYKDYKPGMKVHYSSGIMNKAFCRAAKRFSANGNPEGTATVAGVKELGKIFYKANDNYWVAGSTFLQGCTGTLDAAAELGTSSEMIGWLQSSWSDVGVSCNRDFSMSIPSGTNEVMRGGNSKTATISITRKGGFAAPITLEVTGVPSGVTATLSPNPVTASTASVTLTAASTATLGPASLTVTAKSGASTSSAQVALVVSPSLGDIPSLTSGVPATGISVAKSLFVYYKIVVPTGSTEIAAAISGGTGDADLYVKRGALPTFSFKDCSSGLIGNIESCKIANPIADTYYIGLYGWAQSAGVSLLVTVRGPPVPPTPTPLPPSEAPTDVKASVKSSTAIEVSWTGVARATSYSIENGVDTSVTAVGTATSFVSLSPDTPYQFRVRAINLAGTGPYSSAVTARTFKTPPQTPAGLTATVKSKSSIEVSWTLAANADNHILQKIQNGTFSETVLAGDVNKFVFDNLVPDSTYDFRIKASNNGGDSALSTPITAKTLPNPPEQPDNFAAVGQSTTEVQLNWSDSNNETGYRLERRLAGEQAWSIIADSLPAGTVTRKDQDLVEDSNYEYRLSAFNTGGESSFALASGKTKEKAKVQSPLARVSSMVSPNNSQSPKFAISGTGNIFSAWTEELGAESTLYFNFKATNGLWGAPRRMTSVPSTVVFQPQVAWVTDSVARVVFIERSNGNAPCSLKSIDFDAGTSAFGSESVVFVASTTAEYCFEPLIEVDTAGNAYLVFSTSLDGAVKLMFTEHLANWKTPAVIASGQLHSHSLAVSITGQLAVTYSLLKNNVESVNGIIRANKDSPWDAEAMLSESGISGSGQNRVFFFGETAHAIWTQSKNDRFAVISNRYRNSAWQGPEIIGASATTDYLYPNVSVLNGFQPLVAFVKQADAGSMLVYRTLDPLESWGAEEEISQSTELRYAFPRIVQAKTGDLAAVWIGIRADNTISVQQKYRDDDTAMWSSVTDLNPLASAITGTIPVVHMGPKGELIVIWQAVANQKNSVVGVMYE